MPYCRRRPRGGGTGIQRNFRRPRFRDHNQRPMLSHHFHVSSLPARSIYRSRLRAMATSDWCRLSGNRWNEQDLEHSLFISLTDIDTEGGATRSRVAGWLESRSASLIAADNVLSANSICRRSQSPDHMHALPWQA